MGGDEVFCLGAVGIAVLISDFLEFFNGFARPLRSLVKFGAVELGGGVVETGVVETAIARPSARRASSAFRRLQLSQNPTRAASTITPSNP